MWLTSIKAASLGTLGLSWSATRRHCCFAALASFWAEAVAMKAYASVVAAVRLKRRGRSNLGSSLSRRSYFGTPSNTADSCSPFKTCSRLVANS